MILKKLHERTLLDKITYTKEHSLRFFNGTKHSSILLNKHREFGMEFNALYFKKNTDIIFFCAIFICQYIISLFR